MPSRHLARSTPCRCAGLALFGALLLGSAAPAYAADAYLCGSDSVVYVELDKLEEMKRTNPCIASYYGLTVADPAPIAEPPAQKQKRTGASKAKSPHKSAITGLRLKPLLAAEEGPPSRAERERSILSEVIAEPELVAAPGTDYSNVRVINAKTPNDEWLRLPR